VVTPKKQNDTNEVSWLAIKALTKLAERLAKVPTPDGYTRNQLVQLIPRT